MSKQIEQWLYEAGARDIRAIGNEEINSTCPQCGEHGRWRNRCFSLNIETGLFVCYRPECGFAGHLRRLLIDLLNFSFQEALSATEGMLAWRDVESTAYDLPDWEERDTPSETFDYLSEASLGIYDFIPSYMVRRGFTRATLGHFEIGYDMSRKRVMFPVRDHERRLLGFSSRATHDNDFPRYLHLGFKKSTVLYGECYATPKQRHLVVGEGNVDALALRQLLPNKFLAVSTLGSLVSTLQVRRMLHYPRVYLAFDKDDAGEVATTRVGDALQARGHRSVWVMDFLNFAGCKDPGLVAQLAQERGTKAIPRVRRYSRWLEDLRSKKEET